jgi:hypothetical protein
MSYYLYLIETKKEYTIHLINELTPLMYEGIQSIYQDAKDNSNENEELKLFQSLLRKIPSWNEHLIEQETNRIIKNSSKSDIIEDLINAVIKSNIMILTNTPPEKKDNLQIKHDILTTKFIHNSYIEIARNIFQNPYLFYHKLNSFELKKNQRESHECIKKSIEQAIRKLLPMNVILQNYLGKTFEQNPTNDFENPIIESDYNNLKQMLNKNSEVFQLIKNNKNDDKINIKLELPSAKPIHNTTDNFKSLKELVKQKIVPVNKIDTIKESDNSSSISIVSISETSNNINKINNKNSDSNQLYAKMKQSLNKQMDNNQSYNKQSNYKQSDNKQSDIKQSDIKQSDIKQSDNKESDNKQFDIKQSDNKQFDNKKINCKVVNNDSEDASASYFRQNSSKKEYIEIYDEKNKTHNKQFLNYDKLDEDSSVNLKSINKKKYFSKNNNL